MAVADADPDQPGQRGRFGRARLPRAVARAAWYTWVGHVALLLLYVAAGIAVTWPRAAYLPDGLLPHTPDESSYVWYLWWTAHQLLHPGNPFFTRHLAAPVGTYLGFGTTMPLAGWLMAPVHSLVRPVRLVQPARDHHAGPVVLRRVPSCPAVAELAGRDRGSAFYGLSSMLTWQDWYHINIALGSVSCR